MEELRRRTIGRPLNRRGSNLGRILIHLEPDIALAVKVGRVAAGRLGHVHIDGALVVDVGGDLKGDGVAGGDGQSLGRGGAGLELVASHGRRVDVLDGAVVLPVLGAAGELPVGGGRSAAGAGAGDGVYIFETLVSYFLLKLIEGLCLFWYFGVLILQWALVRVAARARRVAVNFMVGKMINTGINWLCRV